MSSFTKPLTVTKVNKKYWMVAESFTYYISDDLSGDFVFVPKGTLTDFASVPRIFWTILPPDGQYTQGAVVHDVCYARQDFTRKECDQIFLNAMKVLDVTVWKRAVIYRALRMFGWLAWKKKRVNNAKKIKEVA